MNYVQNTLFFLAFLISQTSYTMPKQKSGPKNVNTNAYCRTCNKPMTQYWLNNGHRFTIQHQRNLTRERRKTSRPLNARRRQGNS